MRSPSFALILNNAIATIAAGVVLLVPVASPFVVGMTLVPDQARA